MKKEQYRVEIRKNCNLSILNSHRMKQLSTQQQLPGSTMNSEDMVKQADAEISQSLNTIFVSIS